MIPLAQPRFAGNEDAYVQDCLRTTQVSGSGSYIARFEEAWAARCGARYGIATCNGTAALHLALLDEDLPADAEVIVPDLTFAATANAVMMCGATPVFADVDPITWTMDPNDVRRTLTWETEGILPVHLYGHPTDALNLRWLADSHGLFCIDDAAQAHGAREHGMPVGTHADATCWSFHAAKIITTGEGGMVTTNDHAKATRLRQLRDHGMDPERRFWHEVVGYNYRMTNLQAALGLAQVERFDEIMAARRQVIAWYRNDLADTSLQLPHVPDDSDNVCWLFGVVVPDGVDRDAVMGTLGAAGIETRPFFYPLHTMPPYAEPDPGMVCEYPVSTRLSRQGLCLPVFETLSEAQVAFICTALRGALS